MPISITDISAAWTAMEPLWSRQTRLGNVEWNGMQDRRTENSASDMLSKTLNAIDETQGKACG